MAVPAPARDVPANDNRRPRRSLLLSVGLAGSVAAGAVSIISYGIEEQGAAVDAVLVGWITLAYVVCGLVAWSRRMESRFGPLMIAAGFGPVLSRLSEVDEAVPQTIGMVCLLLPVVLFLHVFLAYPSGRLERPFDSVVLGVGYASAIGLGILAMTLGPSGRQSVIEIAARPETADSVLKAGGVAIAAVAVTAVFRLAARARSSGRALRRSFVRGCFGLAIVALAFGVLLKTFGGPAAAPLKWVAFGLIGLAPVLLLLGFLRVRLARSSVADVFVDLRGDPAPAGLRDALARALHDPSLALVYWLPEFGGYATLDGGGVDLSEVGTGRSVTLIDRDDAHVAALVHDPALEDEPELLNAVTAAAGIALENGRLHAELRARLEELKGSRSRVIEAGQRERQRLERNLHDGAQQRLIALSLELSLLEREVTGDSDARRRLDQARHEIAVTLEELRSIAHGLHPAVLSGHGLEVALQSIVARATVSVRLNVTLESRLPERIEVAAYYVVSESLANIGKHALAGSASIDVNRTDGLLVVEVADDGVGGADTERGSGLRGLADRVESLGGRLLVWSPSGGGTRVRAEMPCA